MCSWWIREADGFIDHLWFLFTFYFGKNITYFIFFSSRYLHDLVLIIVINIVILFGRLPSWNREAEVKINQRK